MPKKKTIETLRNERQNKKLFEKQFKEHLQDIIDNRKKKIKESWDTAAKCTGCNWKGERNQLEPCGVQGSSSLMFCPSCGRLVYAALHKDLLW